MLNQADRLTRYFDWVSIALTVSIGLIGLLFVFSATYIHDETSLFFKKQCIGFCIGIILYFASAFIDYRALLRWGYVLYLFIIILLAFTLIKGSVGMGAQRWVNVFLFKFQPSELAKLFFPAFMAHYLQTHPRSYRTSWDLVPILGALGISFILILKQPDLGTALIVCITGLTLLWVAGLANRFFLWGALVCALATPLIWTTVLKSYQKDRIKVFMGYGASHKERYQIEQSVIAIGSGGVWGKGFLKGTQNKLKFLPESRTDFIFAVLCEEWGLCGALLVLCLYLLLIARSFFLIQRIWPLHAQLLAMGLLLHIALCAVTNIGMVIGLLPIVGIPLPLMSYGISNLLTTMISLGWLQGISMQQAHRGIGPTHHANNIELPEINNLQPFALRRNKTLCPLGGHKVPSRRVTPQRPL